MLHIPPVVAAFQTIINDKADNPATLSGIDRFGFYNQAKQAFTIVQTDKTRLYGNIILKMGVIGT
ncbi:MAG: hypothetical protein IKD58_00940 [Loktanella sp.]|nr:hypothetical protein [Loktanella sp.]